MSNNKSDKPIEMSQFFDERANGYDQHLKQTVTSFDRKKLPPKVDTNNAQSMFDKNLL